MFKNKQKAKTQKHNQKGNSNMFNKDSSSSSGSSSSDSNNSFGNEVIEANMSTTDNNSQS